MTNPPAISVILAVFNGMPYLRQAVQSILDQTAGDYEFIIIDDGSTDASSAVLADFARSDRRIRLISRPNKGLTVTLNEGLGMARGTFIARMDADDVALPDRFAKQLAYMSEHPQCVLLGTRVMLVDPEGQPIKPWPREVTHEEIDAAHLNRGWPVVHPSVMMRRDAVMTAGGYRDQFNTLEDLDLFLRLAEVGQLANLTEILLHYRQHFASVTHTRFLHQAQIRQAIYDETYHRRGQTAPPAAMISLPTPRRPHEQHRLWAWSALAAGHIATARKHALKTVRKAPLSLESWRVLACAVRGR